MSAPAKSTHRDMRLNNAQNRCIESTITLAEWKEAQEAERTAARRGMVKPRYTAPIAD